MARARHNCWRLFLRHHLGLGRRLDAAASARDVTIDPQSAVMAGDPSNGVVVVLERTFRAAVSGDDAGGTLLWDGASWTDRKDLALPAADTAYGDAALYADAAIGRLVVLSSTLHDYSRMWMWTGAAWLQLATR